MNALAVIGRNAMPVCCALCAYHLVNVANDAWWWFFALAAATALAPRAAEK